MKKNGFTLVELLVVISIIAVLSLIGITSFSGIQKTARDAKRKADIDAISKAYESQAYNSDTGAYRALTDADFRGGIPKTPEGGSYGALGAGNTFNVCATLEDSSSYCKAASQGAGAGAAAPPPPPPPPPAPVGCAAFNNQTLQTCVFVSSTSGGTCAPIGGTYYIKCSEISLFSGVATVDCTTVGTKTNMMNYYTADTAGIAPAGTRSIYGVPNCSSGTTTIRIRTTN